LGTNRLGTNRLGTKRPYTVANSRTSVHQIYNMMKVSSGSSMTPRSSTQVEKVTYM